MPQRPETSISSVEAGAWRALGLPVLHSELEASLGNLLRLSLKGKQAKDGEKPAAKCHLSTGHLTAPRQDSLLS